MIRKHNFRRLAALAAALLLLLLAALSAAAIAYEANHECDGAECDICRILSQTQSIVKTAVAPTLFLSFLALTLLRKALPDDKVSGGAAWHTLITLKVELLN